jgi:hypothetical protein
VLVKIVAALSIFLTMGAATTASARAECLEPESPIVCEEEATAEGAQPVAALDTAIYSHHGRSYAHPGRTSVELVATPEARFMTAIELGNNTELQWLAGEFPENTFVQPWDCRQPKRVFHYTLTARAEVGATLTTKVTFHAQLSAHWCAVAKRREARQRAEAERRAAEQRAAERRRSEEAERESAKIERERIEGEQHHFEANCRAVGGTPVEIDGGTKIVCKGPNGGAIIVPE